MKGGKKEKKRNVKNGLSVGEYIRHACDNVIDIFDVVIVAKNFSRITPDPDYPKPLPNPE